ncbi:acyl-CoA dehydrogenase family protein [Williamsia phyllosphaerae]|uniref:Acyl-CoA dehydrogenase (FadE) n=1 Tax=Williamsia phyllosphaerae TaxID=885042 RepID=A0ABQ1UF57_9NOCA|nr:acyl-CoA dehydrogenase family protein [Williamsia phyllosphaerae]GGF17678.1 putative acyl-CoA dehydrogenase (FadE) [Williamsia phyllosphaerae]
MRRTLYGPDHAAFGESVSEFIDRYVTPRHEAIIEQRYIDREIWKHAGESGFLGLEVPEEYGGSEAGDYRFNAMFTELLSGVSAALPSAFGIHVDIVAPYLVNLTTDEQRKRWLPGFCTGDIVTAIAMTEPAAGSDLAGIKTTAKQEGTDWVINGSKTFITNGFNAELVVAAVKTSPEKKSKGITMFAIEKGMPGFERGRKLDKVGQPESDTAELFFTDVRVPAENVIGEVDRGFIHMMTFLPQERLNAAVSNLAHAKALFGETLTYVEERKAFGKSIGSFQFNKFTIAELATQIDVTQAFIDACITAHTEGELSAADAAKAKWWTAEIQNKILDACLQLHGGYGYMNEYRIAQAWKDARVTRIWAGSNEIMKEIIGRDLGF